jgi:lambda family phage minor tail protein L
MEGAEYLKNECINREIFSQNPSVSIEFFEISDIANTSEIIRFHGGINGLRSSVLFDSQEYYYVPYLAEDFGTRSDGKLTRPQLSMVNFEGIFSRYITNKDDLLGASVRRIKTFLRFLDEENFINYNQDIDYWNSMGVNPDSTSKLMDETWVINQKVLENKNLIKYELSSPLDLENAIIPKRQIINNYCAWKYRGKGCRYSGPPKADSNDVVFNATLTDKGEWAESTTYTQGDFVFLNIKDGQLTRKVFYVCLLDNTSNNDNKPSVNSSVWSQDACSKSLSGCRLRFKGDNDDHLPFGGFPGSRLF